MLFVGLQNWGFSHLSLETRERVFVVHLAFHLEIECEISVYVCFQLQLVKLDGLSHAVEQHLLFVSAQAHIS